MDTRTVNPTSLAIMKEYLSGKTESVRVPEMTKDLEGLISSSTINRGLAYMFDNGMIIRSSVKSHNGKPTYKYRLDPAFKVDVGPKKEPEKPMRNGENYYDPTAGAALKNVAAEGKRIPKRGEVWRCVGTNGYSDVYDLILANNGDMIVSVQAFKNIDRTRGFKFYNRFAGPSGWDFDLFKLHTKPAKVYTEYKISIPDEDLDILGTVMFTTLGFIIPETVREVKVEVPVEKIVEKEVVKKVKVEVPVEKIVEKEVKVEVPVEKIVEAPINLEVVESLRRERDLYYKMYNELLDRVLK